MGLLSRLLRRGPSRPENTAPTARGVLPDVVTDREVFLLKAPSYLRLTYEIRLATHLAKSSGRRLVLSVPSHAQFSPELESFLAQHSVAVRRGKP